MDLERILPWRTDIIDVFVTNRGKYACRAYGLLIKTKTGRVRLWASRDAAEKWAAGYRRSLLAQAAQIGT